MYKLSQHAAQMIAERDLDPMAVCAAMDGRRRVMPDGIVRAFDPATRVSVVLDEERMVLITCYKIKPATIKRIFSR